MNANDTPIEYALPTGEIVLIDPVDSDIAEMKWSRLSSRHYAKRNDGKANRQFILMHRLIMERMLNRRLSSSEGIDHINGNGFDNRRANLRIANQCQNMGNARLSKANTTGYKGVTFNKKLGRYIAQISVMRRRRHLGLFDTAEEAHEAYKRAAIEAFGEFARFE